MSHDPKLIFVDFLKNAGITINGNKPFDIQIKDNRTYREVWQRGSLGAGEAYMAGWWECERLDDLFYRICRLGLDMKFQNKWVVMLGSLKNLLLNMQTKLRSLMVAEKHYNIGNELYQNMLGPSMAYTCGYWNTAQTLHEAQYEKFNLICRKIGLSKQDRLLELGCGWGTFAKYAAETYGCEVVAVNISREQVNYAQKICKDLPVKIYLCDYRDTHIYNHKSQPFDKIVSIGLCEHVGFKNYQSFIKLVLDQSKKESLFLLHTIGRSETSYFTDLWIRKYIFPNGSLPSLKLLTSAFENKFVLEDLHNFGADYDRTLMEWHKNFIANWDVLERNYDETFFRLWNYYLLTCAGAFRARTMQLWQMVLSPRGVAGGYESQR
jgi:cyclopropane-fatty-acyl-phospholipid synthase